MNNDDNELMFADDDDLLEAEAPSTSDLDPEPWKIIIADDDSAIHTVTEMALDNFVFGRKGLEFIHAYSGEEAVEAVKTHPDAALILLDVVMETDHAGLDSAQYIREYLNNKSIRIILRTGQPGQAPEKDVIIRYDINDYKEKTELTAQKLFTLMYASLRSYRDIITLEMNRRGLERVIESSANIFEIKNLTQFTEGVLTQLTSLLNIDQGAAYIKHKVADGIALSYEGEQMNILAGTGRFSGSIGKDATSELDEAALKDVRYAIEREKHLYHEDRFTGYFKNYNDTENILHLSSQRPLNDVDKSLMEVFSKNISIAYENIELHHEIEETQSDIIYMLGEAVETRSKETGNHVKRVAQISKLLALECGFSEDEAEVIRFASPLHDVGKIGIPDAILNKPGKHTPEEWEIMKTHAMLGYDMLKASNKRILRAGALIARDHHEKWTGGGYPFNRQSDDIHIYGRITAVADVFDALGSERCYKKAWALEKIVALMNEEKGQQFDPTIVDILLNNMDKVNSICAAYPDVIKD